MPASVHSEIVFEGVRFRVERIDAIDARGARHRRDVVRHPGGAVILPVRDDGAILLIRNRRVAVGASLWELPAGTRDDAEPPRETAAREVAEETGHRAGRLEAIGSFYTSPGVLDEVLHVFVATELEPVGQSLDDGEEIEVVPTALDDALAMIDDGRIRDAKTIAGLLMWDRRRRASAEHRHA